MVWTVEKIERDWLGGSIEALASRSDEVVAAFTRVEEMLGLPWLEDGRTRNGSLVVGTAPTLNIVSMGLRLAALDRVEGSERLLKKIKSGDTSANAELTAIYLARHSPQIQVELEPAVGARAADFRVREENGDWVYVEVTFPDWSKATERVQSILQRLVSVVSTLKKPVALEVFLRREPSEAEISSILDLIPKVCDREGSFREDLADDLGFLLLNDSKPGEIIIKNHGENPRPVLAVASAISGPGEFRSHVAVRLAYSDQRAEQFLDSEAGQLPKNAPGLIMIGVSRAPGGIAVWEPIYKKQFELKLHTQVSGILLFSGGLLPSPKGQVWLPQTKLILNPYALNLLPDWIKKSLVASGEEFETLSKGKS